MSDDKPGLDYAALEEEARTGGEPAKLEALKRLKGDPGERARALLQKLSADESLRVRAEAKVLLKDASARKSGAAGARRGGAPPAGIDPEILWHVALPLAALLALGLFAPPVPPVVFLLGFHFLILHVALRFDKSVALPAAGVIALLAATAYIFQIMPTFRPNAVTVVLYMGGAALVSFAVSGLRDEAQIREARIGQLMAQLSSTKELLERKKSEKQVEEDMNQIDRLKEDLKAKTRKSLEVIAQLNLLLSERSSNGVVNRIGKILERQLSIEGFSIWFIDPVKSELYPIHASGSDFDRKATVPIGETLLIARAAREGGVIRLDEVKRGADVDAVMNDRAFPTTIALALEGIDEKGRARTLGVVSVEDAKAAEKLTPEEFELLKAVARNAAYALSWSGDLELAKTDLVNIRQITEQEKEEKKRIKGLFGKFVAPSVVEEILKNPDAISLGGKRRKVTLFFADIRGFTAMSERMADRPETVIEIVNLFLSTMTNVIINKGGTLDKYMGDALMALFGAPIARPDDAYRAVEAAVAIRRETQKIWEKLLKSKKIAVNVGIGINTAEVVVGMVGSHSMMNYTAIGDGVNTAARIEANAKAGQILISSSTRDECADFIKCKELPPITVKGKSQPIPVFEVEDITDMFLI